jgi:dephospho-CoA kinase
MLKLMGIRIGHRNFLAKATIFALTGLSECGKETLALYFESKGVARYKIDQLLRRIQKEDHNDESFEDWNFREEGCRPDWLVAKFLDELDKEQDYHGFRAASIDSLYGTAMGSRLRDALGNNFAIIYVDAPYELRVLRQMKRSNLSTLEAARNILDKKDALKISKGNLLLRELADDIVDNSTTMESLYNQGAQILRRYGIRKD